MPVIWCAITGHGYGHAAQTVPVLNELGRRIPNLNVVLGTTVPDSFFEPRLTIPWKRLELDQGGGCVQQGPLSINIPATWSAYQEFHENWEERVNREIAIIRSCTPDLILSNISYLALEAGAKAHIPSIALASLTWDEVMEVYIDRGNVEHGATINLIRESYRCASHVIRLMPSLGMGVFKNVTDVGPIGQPPVAPNVALREKIRWKPHVPLVLVALGGVPVEALPVEAIQTMTNYQFLVDSPVSDGSGHLRPLSDIPATFDEIFAVADCVVTKPGYATIIEAVAHRKPVVYVRRFDFADEDGLVKYLHRYGRGYEMAKEDFVEGTWQKALDVVSQLSHPAVETPESGVEQAADILASYLS